MVLSGLMTRTTIGLLSVVALVVFAPVASATPESDADAAITAAWQANGGDTGPLGPKDGGVYPAGDGFGQNFPGGKIFFTPATGAHIMTGAILDKYSDSRPSTRVQGRLRTAATRRSALPTTPSSSSPLVPVRGWYEGPSTPPGTSSAAPREL
jgi:uncharacterized protein with LGFP repeats